MKPIPNERVVERGFLTSFDEQVLPVGEPVV